MKIKLICKPENYDLYKSMLEEAGFSVSYDAKLTFREDDFKRDTFIGQINDNYEMVKFDSIILIESFGHEIICHTVDKKFKLREKLYELENILYDVGFIRVNKSQIINKAYIKEIKPTFNYRIILKLKNKKTIYVTRNYLQKFKKYIGF